MLYEVTGDLVKDKQYTMFCHQTNCRGRMGSGIAKQIADTYPIVAARDAQYHKICVTCRGGEHAMLGTIMGSRTDDGRVCINMYAQENYGTDKRQTDYMAFARCLALIRDDLMDYPPETKVAFPDHIGCGLASGDWKIVRNLIESFSRMIRQDVYIVKLER